MTHKDANRSGRGNEPEDKLDANERMHNTGAKIVSNLLITAIIANVVANCARSARRRRAERTGTVDRHHHRMGAQSDARAERQRARAPRRGVDPTRSHEHPLDSPHSPQRRS